jgi:carbonic anhydrase
MVGARREAGCNARHKTDEVCAYAEGVQWILLRNPVYIFEEDYVDLHELLGDNYRPVQPLNGRVVSTLV